MAKKPIVQGGVENYLGKQPQVVAPRKWQSSPDAPPTELAYITKAEKDLILKKDIHGSLSKGPNIGPSGIMSLDSFGDIGGAGAGGADTEASGGAKEGASFSGRGPSETRSAFEARKRNQREIVQKAEDRQADRLDYNARKNISNFKSKKGPFGIGSLFSTLLGFVNPFLGLASRAFTGIPGLATQTFNTFKNSPTLVDFISNMRNQNPTGVNVDEDDDTTLLDQVSPDLPFAKTYLQSLQQNTTVPLSKPNRNLNVNLLAQPSYNLDGTVRSDSTGYLDNFDPSTGQFDNDDFGLGGITKTQQFDESPYGRIGNYDEIQ